MARVQLAVLKMAGALIFVLVAASLSWGQITNLNTASTPVAGSGHDYMHMLNETVNPRDGSLSMRIHVNPPRGRLLSLPFAFAYDSNGAHFANAWPGYPPEWFTNTTFLSN